MNSSSHFKTAGFTLLELLISIFILVFISIGATQLYSQTFKIRETLLQDGEFYNQIRLALTMIEADMTSMYTPLMVLPEAPKTLTQEQTTELNRRFRGDENLEGQYWGPIVHQNGLRPSRFFGKESRVTFLSNSHRRIYKESPESIFTKIEYSLQQDDKPKPGQEGTQILIKKSTSNAFDPEDTEEGDPFFKMYRVLRGIKKLKFRFYRLAENKWLEEWDSSKPELKNRFPDAIEVEIDAVGPINRLKFQGRFRFRPEIPVHGLQARF